MICYSGENYLNDIPIHGNIVVKNDERLSVILNNAVNFEGSSEKISEKNYYVLHLYGSLTLIGIQVFFDICIPKKESVDDFKIKID